MNFLEIKNTGKNLLNKIKSCFGKLPSKGFIAGGAPAALLHNEAHGTNYPINDVDIFLPVSTRIPVADLPMPKMDVELKTHIDIYGHIDYHDYDVRRSYRVLNSTRDGDFNYVDVALNDKYSSIEAGEIILNGFDINACQVGVDIETSKLRYTKEFEYFFETQQLKVVRPHTPFHTAIRVVKKIDDLKCYCNLDEEMTYLSYVPLILPKYNNLGGTLDYAVYFGKKYYDMAMKHIDVLERYFKIISIKEKPIKFLHGNHEDLFFPIPIKFKKVNDLFTMEPLNQTVDACFTVCKNVTDIKYLWDLLKMPKAKAEKNRRAIQVIGRRSLVAMIFNPQYAQCDWNEKHLYQIEEFLTQHASIGGVFLKMDLNIQQQAEAINLIKRKEKQHGRFITGLIEKSKKLPVKISPAWIDRQVKKLKSALHAKLAQPLDLSGFNFKANVKELTTIDELLKEGERMHNCVGGYAMAVNHLRCRVYHIEVKDAPSTAEIQFEDGKYWIVQHKGVNNTEPLKGNKKLARKLLEYINKTRKIKHKPIESAEQDVFDFILATGMSPRWRNRFMQNRDED